jgi:hypothetical protein
MGTTSSWIKRSIAKMREGQIFSTKVMLRYGKRSTVDQGLRRLVAQGVIIRVARGLFVRTFDGLPEKTPWPSIKEMADEKACVYGKRVRLPGRDMAQAFGVDQKETGGIEFAVSGCSSSFLTCRGRVIFKRVSENKLDLGDSIVGRVLRGLWHIGREQVENSRIDRQMTIKLGRKARTEMASLIQKLPAWLYTVLNLPIKESAPTPGKQRTKRESEFDSRLMAKFAPSQNNTMPGVPSGPLLDLLRCLGLDDNATTRASPESWGF